MEKRPLRKQTSGIFALIFFFSTGVLWAYADESRIEHVVIGTTMKVKTICIDDRSFGHMMGLFTHMSLTRLSSEGQYVGDLAAGWHTKDAVTWDFKLRPNLKWHDGINVSSEDVKFTYEYLLETLPVYRSHFNLLKRVEALDDLTVRVILSKPNSQFLVNVCSICILPKHIFSQVKDPRKFHGKGAAVGCGPFVFTSYDRTSGVLTFTANDNYYKGTPNVKTIYVRLFNNPDTLYLALKKREIDLPYIFPMTTDPSTLRSLRGHPHVAFCSANNMGVPKVLFFNTQKPPVDDPGLRRALSLAIDYDKLIRYFSFDYGVLPNSGFLPRGTPGFIDTSSLVYDPEKAGALLKNLGYEDRDGDGILEKEGSPLQLECVLWRDIADNSRIAEFIKKNFSSVGVGLQLKYVDANVLQSIVIQEKSHTLLLHRTTPWGMMSWAGGGSAYFDERNMGWTRTDDGEYYRIVDRMNAALTPEAYQIAIADLQQYYSKKLSAIPMFWNRLVFPYDNRLTGWKLDFNYGVLNRESWFNLKEEKDQTGY